jgi:acetyl-CoA acyltransferase 1
LFSLKLTPLSFTTTYPDQSSKFHMAARLSQIVSHLAEKPISAKLKKSQIQTEVGVKSPYDVVVVDAVRTAQTKMNRGGFKDTVP